MVLIEIEIKKIGNSSSGFVFPKALMEYFKIERGSKFDLIIDEEGRIILSPKENGKKVYG